MMAKYVCDQSLEKQIWNHTVIIHITNYTLQTHYLK